MRVPKNKTVLLAAVLISAFIILLASEIFPEYGNIILVFILFPITGFLWFGWGVLYPFVGKLLEVDEPEEVVKEPEAEAEVINTYLDYMEISLEELREGKGEVEKAVSDALQYQNLLIAKITAFLEKAGSIEKTLTSLNTSLGAYKAHDPEFAALLKILPEEIRATTVQEESNYLEEQCGLYRRQAGSLINRLGVLRAKLGGQQDKLYRLGVAEPMLQLEISLQSAETNLVAFNSNHQTSHQITSHPQKRLVG